MTMSFICPIDQGNHYLGVVQNSKKLALDKRFDIVKKHSLCFNCLYDHKLNNCRSKKRCKQDNCDQKHHSNEQREKSEADSINLRSRILSLPDADDSINPDSLSGNRNQLQRLSVTLINDKNSIQFYAMLKTCSSCSEICKFTAEKLKSTPEQSVDLKIHEAISTDKIHSTLIKLSVAALKSASMLFTLPNVYSV